MTALTFPSNPTVGQIYDAPNGIQYVYDGVKWSVENVASSSEAVTNSVQDRVAPMFVDGDNQGITFNYNAETNTISATVTSTIGNTLVNGTYQAVLETDGKLSLPSNIIDEQDPENSVITGIRFGDNTIQTTAFNLNEYGDFYTGNFLASGAGLTGYGGSVFIRASRPNAESTLDFIFKENGQLELPAGGDIVDSNGTSVLGGSGSTDRLVNGSYDVTLDVNGNTTFPSQTYIRQNNSYTRTVNGDLISGVPTVIWSGTNDNITSVKMTIQVEGNETGDTTGWHTQTCEAVIAERYWGNLGTLDPTMSVYGVVHTSVAPLATFSVQRNPTTHVIELVATPTGTAGTLRPKVHSVEMLTRD